MELESVVMRSFPTHVQEKLKYYVYRLIDPRNGSTFYIGKGKGNRVFYHATLADNSPDFKDGEIPCADRIREIKSVNLEPTHIIHRHGMSEREAFEVEAALIDVFDGQLTNVATGHGSHDRGPAHVQQLVEDYGAEAIEFKRKDKIIVIKIRSETQCRLGTYSAVRASWKVNLSRAQRAEIILATVNGICRGVYVECKWRESKEYPGPPPRYEFDGTEAPENIADKYLNKRLPDEMTRKGAANPIFYTYE